MISVGNLWAHKVCRLSTPRHDCEPHSDVVVTRDRSDTSVALSRQFGDNIGTTWPSQRPRSALLSFCQEEVPPAWADRFRRDRFKMFLVFWGRFCSHSRCAVWIINIFASKGQEINRVWKKSYNFNSSGALFRQVVENCRHLRQIGFQSEKLNHEWFSFLAKAFDIKNI